MNVQAIREPSRYNRGHGTLTNSGLTSSSVVTTKIAESVELYVFIPEGKAGWIKIKQQHSTAKAQTGKYREESQ